jgi:hypothetical protein
MMDIPERLKHSARHYCLPESHKDSRGLHPLHSGAAALAQFALSGISPYSWFDHCCMSALVLNFAVLGYRRGPFRTTRATFRFSPQARQLARAPAVNSLPPD